tara:strand:+ start:352 stop:1341 length:990 start_codon:yes stop_codon:yes gene_type:complete
MNFSEFQDHRSRLLAEHSELLDLAETNLYRALARLKPTPPPEPEGRIHRCDLARQWAEFYGFSAVSSGRVLVSGGVRDALGTVFRHLQGKACRIWLPEDNYPVYHQLASEFGHEISAFTTLPEAEWPQASAPDDAKSEWMVVTHPMKPRGRALNTADVAATKRWLECDPKRRLLIDAVYSLTSRFDGVTTDLLKTGQVWLLHSVTKGWLYPRTFGVAQIPEEDEAEWLPVFRDAPPSHESLVIAEYLLRANKETPRQIAVALGDAQRQMRDYLKGYDLQWMEIDTPGYLNPVLASYEELIAKGILGLPAAAFGSSRDDISILSSLHFAS